MVKILVNRLQSKAIKSLGLLFPPNFGVNMIVVSLLEAIHPALAKRLCITFLFKNGLNNFAENSSRRSIPKGFLIDDPVT
jgi:hypothetical protein